MQGLSPIWMGFLGSLIAGLGTGVGALPVFVRGGFSARSQRLLLAAAGGMMLSASFFSLILPALDLVREEPQPEWVAVLIVSAGTVLGAVALWGFHALVPHAHFGKGREGPSRWNLGRHSLFVLAIALHNLPEGLSVGVAYGGSAAIGHAVMLGIACQNMPEGLAVAAALISDGMSRGRAFVIALGTGLIEPIGGLIGALAVSVSAAVLPWGLAFAAGAMLFVVSGEVLPETHSEGDERPATLAVVLGVVAMMAIALLLG